MEPFTAIAGGGSTVLDFVGGLIGNSSARKEAKRNREFQERMSSTAHQREVADLKAAGLNPMLSGMGGSGSSTPGGSQAAQSNPFEGAANSARDLSAKNMQTKINNAQIDNMEAENQRIREQTKQLQISNAQQGIMTPAYLEAGKAIESGIGGVKKLLGIQDAGDIVQDVLDAGSTIPTKLANGDLNIPSGALDLARLVGTEKSEARKWATGQKSFRDSLFDATRESVRINSAKKLDSETLRKWGVANRAGEAAKTRIHKWTPKP